MFKKNCSSAPNCDQIVTNTPASSILAHTTQYTHSTNKKGIYVCVLGTRATRKPVFHYIQQNFKKLNNSRKKVFGSQHLIQIEASLLWQRIQLQPWISPNHIILQFFKQRLRMQPHKLLSQDLIKLPFATCMCPKWIVHSSVYHAFVCTPSCSVHHVRCVKWVYVVWCEGLSLLFLLYLWLKWWQVGLHLGAL